MLRQHLVDPIERLAEAVLAIHEIDKRDLDRGNDREATFLPVGERSEAVDCGHLYREVESADAGEFGRQHDEIRWVRQRREPPVEQERHCETPLGILGCLRCLHEHVL